MVVVIAAVLVVLVFVVIVVVLQSLFLCFGFVSDALGCCTCCHWLL